MAAFDRIRCGFDELDEILDYIRLGDNVVWQITELDEFRMFAEPFVRQAVKDGRDVVYIRFAQHEPLIRDLSGVCVFETDPDAGFESFTVAVRNEITRHGKDAFYVFDCLSELQSVWYTDLMMGNFFRVTCPYLFILDTVAYFPLIRGRHSYDAVGRIRDTTQLLLDVCSDEKYVYLQPIKVWRRDSERMFLPHGYKKSTGRFATVENGVMMSRYYQRRQQLQVHEQDRSLDSYDRFFNAARIAYMNGEFTEETEDMIIASTMTKDPNIRALVKRYFKPEDYFLLWGRIVGSGAIGGKACGMLTARKICETEIEGFEEHNEPHDSFYIGSDVFYTYIVNNDGWNARIRQRSCEEYFTAAEDLRECLMNGVFPEKIRERFMNIIEYFGESPFIVRSSSFLEDGFGNAFAGKYESIFCVNRGEPEERLKAFEQAVRIVYSSTMSYSALEYRRLRGLDRTDEQMALLVQRVSGTYYGDYFMPCAAGVGYSHSAYKWLPDMDPSAGMLRIVMGLGTKAVDRTKEDYPRLANLDRPGATVHTSWAAKHKYSQRYIDVLDVARNMTAELSLEKLLPHLPMWYRKIVLEHDRDAESYLRENGVNRQVWFASCQNLLENKAFTGLMQRILKTLGEVYNNAVDIEYTVNLDEDGDFVINLLQCRPLYTSAEKQKIDIDGTKFGEKYFDIVDSSMGSTGYRDIDVIIQIEPEAYCSYPYAHKHDFSSAVGEINRYYRDSGKKLMLVTPGRIGTSSPDLGVPVVFGEISAFSVICEVSDRKNGYMPELSYGSHMFQDLVEAEILYGAIFENEKTLAYAPQMFDGEEDLFLKICPDCKHLEGMIHVRNVNDLGIWLDSRKGRAVCARKGSDI